MSTTKERLHQLVDEMPEQLAVESQNYAEYLRTRPTEVERDRLSLALLDSRYGPDEEEYTAGDARQRPE